MNAERFHNNSPVPFLPSVYSVKVSFVGGSASELAGLASAHWALEYEKGATEYWARITLACGLALWIPVWLFWCYIVFYGKVEGGFKVWWRLLVRCTGVLGLAEAGGRRGSVAVRVGVAERVCLARCGLFPLPTTGLSRCVEPMFFQRILLYRVLSSVERRRRGKREKSLLPGKKIVKSR